MFFDNLGRNKRLNSQTEFRCVVEAIRRVLDP